MVFLTWIPKPHIEFVFVNEKLNLCDMLVQLSHPCPLHPGKYVFFYQKTIPSVLPKVIIYPNFIVSAFFCPLIAGAI